VIKKIKYRKWEKIIRNSGYFDYRYYLFTYSDIREMDVDPVMHYIKFGAKEGRNPSENFDTNFYLKNNIDIDINKVNPLVHYILYGKKEKRLANFRKIENNQSKNNCNTILFISHEASLTGAPIVLLELIKWFKQNTLFDLKLILLRGGPLYRDGVFQKYVETLLVGSDVSIEKLQLFCPNASVIYGNTVAASGVYEKLQYLKAPIISHVHEQEGVLQTFPKQLQIMKKYTDYYITASDAVKENLLTKHKIAVNKVKTVFSFIDNFANIEDIDKKSHYKKRLQLNEHKLLVVGCGTESKSFHKGSDLFVEIANLIVNRYKNDVVFIWVGDIKPNEMRIINKTIKKYQLEKHIDFLGLQERKYVRKLFKASDIFLLSSREDSFPLVALEAAQVSMPIVCFDEAGGMPSFVQKDAGIVVPFLDIEEMAKSVNELIENDILRIEYGKKAHKKVVNNFSIEQKSLEIFSIINKVLNKNTKVSVIVPNYNHSKYLDERIESILNQTIKEIEVIILDDKSPDKSIDVIKKYTADKRVSVIVNQINSGSVFKQWIKGIKIANSNFIWIAESDDKCENTFLEMILEKFKEKDVCLAYSQSKVINGKNKIVANNYFHYTDDLNVEKWKKDYIDSYEKELIDGLAIKNTIPNASAVVFKKFDTTEFYNNVEGMKIAGDWLFYLHCLQNGKIAFVSKALNCHRRHPQSVVSKNDNNRAFINEIIKIQKYILVTNTLPMGTVNKMKNHIIGEIERLYSGKELEEEKKRLDYFPSLTIMLVVSEFNYGGGEIFPIRLANALKKTGINVLILNVEHQPTHPDVEKMVDKSIKIVSVKSWKNKKDGLHNLVKTYGVNAIYSYVWWADKFIANNIGGLNTAWGVCMCGCHENLTQSPKIDPDFHKLMPKINQRANKFLYLTQKNLLTFDKYPLTTKEKLVQVYIGYEPDREIEAVKKESLGISKESFVFGLIARAIPEKGWQRSIDLIIELRNRGFECDLVLCGESKYSKKLKLKYKNYQFIHFVGYVSNTAKWIKMFDVGLLPSFFPSEALPNIVIEYLAYEKPVISTNIGEIPKMINSDKGDAGIIVSYDDKKEASLVEMVDFASEVMQNKQKYETYQKRASLAYKEKFSMQVCAQKYIQITKELKQ